MDGENTRWTGWSVDAQAIGRDGAIRGDERLAELARLRSRVAHVETLDAAAGHADEALALVRGRQFGRGNQSQGSQQGDCHGDDG